MNETLPEFLTTKEIAALLRVRERKVYEIPALGRLTLCRLVNARIRDFGIGRFCDLTGRCCRHGWRHGWCN